MLKSIPLVPREDVLCFKLGSGKILNYMPISDWSEATASSVQASMGIVTPYVKSSTPAECCTLDLPNIRPLVFRLHFLLRPVITFVKQTQIRLTISLLKLTTRISPA
jgi:hypothetical protein